MIKRILLALLFFLFLSNPVDAAWVKYEQNPVLSPGPDIWDNAHISSPTIIYVNDNYRMWYQGYNGNKWSIGLAESTDGKSWHKLFNNPVIAPFNEPNLIETDIVEPTIIKNDIYRIWFNSFNNLNNDYKIRYATSLDGISWQKITNPVMIGEKEWEKKGVANPSIIYKDGKYYMWYIGWGFNSPWQIGLAESIDGINWTKYSNNPLSLPSLGHVSAPDVTYINGKYHMFYHTGQGIPTEIYYTTSIDGINWQCENSCQVIKSEGTGFDSQMMGAPTLSVINNKWYLFYGGFNGSNWQIGLATKDLPPTPTPTSTPTPTLIPISTPTPSPTPTPTPTPTPQSKTPVVLVPGFMASWNKEAILHNEAGTPDGWTMAPFVREYDAIINTFKNLGYTQNQDFFIYTYDWRKKLDNDADNFNSYLQQKIWNNQPQAKINIIGHSLGGLVGRIFAQKYSQNKINNLITVVSPHKGTAQIYKAVEGGELDKSNSLLWLTEKLALILNKSSFETDKETINKQLPVLKDMLPTYDFLKKSSNQFIPINQMQIKNNTLLSYNSNQQIVYPYLTTYVGDKGNTLSGFNITNRTPLDQLLNLYPDGRPISNLTDRGDFLVLSQSAGIGDKIKTLPQDHSEIIYSKDSIKEILNSLQIPYQETQIAEGRATSLSPSLIFLIKSPAQMEVVFNGTTYQEQDGIIFIENAVSGNYELKVKGVANGPYNVVIGQVTASADSWNSITGNIIQSPLSSQTDNYSISFDQNQPKEFFIDENNKQKLINEIITSIKVLNNPSNNHLSQAIKKLEKYKKPEDILSVHDEIFKAMNRIDSSKWNNLMNIVAKVEHLYDIVSSDKNTRYITKKLEIELKIYEKELPMLQIFLNIQKRLGHNVTKKALLLGLANKKLEKAKLNFRQQNYRYTEILLQSVEELMKLVKTKIAN